MQKEQLPVGAYRGFVVIHQHHQAEPAGEPIPQRLGQEGVPLQETRLESEQQDRAAPLEMPGRADSAHGPAGRRWSLSSNDFSSRSKYSSLPQSAPASLS